MDDVEAARRENLPREPGLMKERASIFAQIAARRVALRRQPMAVDMDAFEILFLRFVALAFGTDDGNLRPGGDERERLLPNPPVEGNRKVLDDDEDLPSREGLLRGRRRLIRLGSHGGVRHSA